jgi:hypothetical protein
MTLAEPGRTTHRGAPAIEAAILSMGYVDDSQADGPHPDMYKYRSNHRANKLVVMPRTPAQGELN